MKIVPVGKGWQKASGYTSPRTPIEEAREVLARPPMVHDCYVRDAAGVLIAVIDAVTHKRYKPSEELLKKDLAGSRSSGRTKSSRAKKPARIGHAAR